MLTKNVIAGPPRIAAVKGLINNKLNVIMFKLVNYGYTRYYMTMPCRYVIIAIIGMCYDFCRVLKLNYELRNFASGAVFILGKNLGVHNNKSSGTTGIMYSMCFLVMHVLFYSWFIFNQSLLLISDR